eukprot:Platyproteum_vivax@DN16634_c0_g1_i1.p1
MAHTPVQYKKPLFKWRTPMSNRTVPFEIERPKIGGKDVCVLLIGALSIGTDDCLFLETEVLKQSGCRAITVATSIKTRKNGKTYFEPLSCDQVKQQIDDAESTYKINAIKVGVLPSSEIAEVVVGFLMSVYCPVVLDPLFVSARNNGEYLLEETDDEKLREMCQMTFPYATLVTPNIREAEVLLSADEPFHIHSSADMQIAAERIQNTYGCMAVYITGGALKQPQRVPDPHQHDNANEVRDVLKVKGRLPAVLSDAVITEGIGSGELKAGCVLSVIIAAQLARENPIFEASRYAMSYVFEQVFCPLLQKWTK